jgi:hypothetical protein
MISQLGAERWGIVEGQCLIRAHCRVEKPLHIFFNFFWMWNREKPCILDVMH